MVEVNMKKYQYIIGKTIVKLSGVTFISAFMVAIATENVDFSVGMVIFSLFSFIIGGFMLGFSPEEKQKAAERMAKYKAENDKRMKEAELKEKSNLKKDTTHGNGPNMWLIGGLGALVAFPFMVIFRLAKKYDD